MRLNTEIVNDKQKALVISKSSHSFISDLEKKLKKSSIDYYFSPIAPKDYTLFDYCFFINEKINLTKVSHYHDKKFVYIFLNKQFNKNQILNKNIKIINISGSKVNEEDIDKILWFTFSETKETILNLKTKEFSGTPIFVPKKTFNNKFLKFFNKKTIIFSFIGFLIIYYFSFVPFLIGSTFLTYRSYVSFKKDDWKKAEIQVKKGEKLSSFTKKFYFLSRPTLLLFGLALPTDNLIDINNRGQTVIKNALSMLSDIKKIEKLMFLKNKNDQEISDFDLRMTNINNDLKVIGENLTIIGQKIPSNLFFSKEIKNNLIDTSDNLLKFNKFLNYFYQILKSPDEKKYLVFFTNDREIRPGGGFLGSFGIVKIKNYSIEDIIIHDVYDADGQLTGHIDPPYPIKKYLAQPHWFLRDSNFSPDFFENYQKALFFLEKEINIVDFEGGILITTTAIENILTSFPNIYLPDYKEYINSANFYLKTQDKVEKNFFPGSTQKRTYLSSLVNQLLLNLENISIKKFAVALKKSLDEKQIVAYFNDQNIQAFFDSSYWSGRVISPLCTVKQNACLLDYIFPYDANVGANKANFFINRYYYLKTYIKNSQINHLLSIQYKNNSPGEFFPTGYYRNYFQLLLPVESKIASITKDGVIIEEEEINIKDDLYKVVGFFVEVPPKKTIEIRINYSLSTNLIKGNNIYQLIFQKQIGATNSDLVLEFETDNKTIFSNQNFSPIVKDNKIIYNTSLSTDKIFLIELIND